jgi:hypothetical protein
MCISNMIMLTMATIDFTKLKKLMPMSFFPTFCPFFFMFMNAAKNGHDKAFCSVFSVC